MINVKINIKKMGKIKKMDSTENKLDQMVYQYSEAIKTVKEFLTETVKISRKEFQIKRDAEKMIAVLSKEELEIKAESGKVTYGILGKDNLPEESKSIENALQCFEDGLVVLFIDGKKMEHLAEQIELFNECEVSFVKMTMLAGRMW